MRIWITQEPNTRRAQLPVHVGIVNDLAGQVHGPVRVLQPGLVGVVNGAVDPVAKSELTREPNGQSSRAMRVAGGLDLLDSGTVIIIGQSAGDRVLKIEPFAEDD